MKQFIPYFLVMLCSFSMAFGQTVAPERFGSLGVNFSGMGWSKSTIASTGKDQLTQMYNPGLGILEGVNGDRKISVIANSGIGVFGGFTYKGKHNNYTGIEMELQRNRACYTYKLPFLFNHKGETMGNWVDSDDYFKVSAAITRSFRLYKSMAIGDTHWYIRESFGLTFHHRNFGIALQPGYTENWMEDSSGMISRVLDAKKQSLMLGSEIGRMIRLPNNRTLDIGLVYYLPVNDTRHMEYDFFRKGIPTSTNVVSYRGSTIMLNLRYTILYKMKDKPVDSTKFKAFQDLAEKTDSAAIKHHDKTYHHHKVNGRRFEVQQSLEVNANVVTVTVWDKNRVDGDEISLYLNEELILDKYTVSKKKKEITLNLKPGKNVLVMHALNLGRIPPNTAAIKINDGTNSKNVTLISDLKKSGAIELIYNP